LNRKGAAARAVERRARAALDFLLPDSPFPENTEQARKEARRRCG